MKLFPLKRIGFRIVLIFLVYHVVFGTVRFFIDIGYPMCWYDNTIIAFGTQLRIGIRHKTSPQSFNMWWYLVDFQPERQEHPEHGFIRTMLDNNVYDYVVDMGWFYRYKTIYVYGRNGFWSIQDNPFHIKLLRSENIPTEDAQKLDAVIEGYNCYGNQFTVVQSESNLTQEEKNVYALMKKKAQPRIKKLKEQGLYP